VEARDAWDALTLARSRSSRIDLLLTDIVRPDMNGPQIAQHVVAMHPKIRVLYVSGCPQASALGGQAISDRVSFLPKAFTPGTLLASVRDALDSWAPLQDTNVWRWSKNRHKCSCLVPASSGGARCFPNNSDGSWECVRRVAGHVGCSAVVERAM